jgi:thymidylate synthase ThyX
VGYIPRRLKAKKGLSVPTETELAAVDQLCEISLRSKQIYDDIDEAGFVNEQARFAMAANTFIKARYKIDLRNLFHLLNERTERHAQDETRWISEVIAGMVHDSFPLNYDAWIEHDRCSLVLSDHQARSVLRRLSGEEGDCGLGEAGARALDAKLAAHKTKWFCLTGLIPMTEEQAWAALAQ